MSFGVDEIKISTFKAGELEVKGKRKPVKTVCLRYLGATRATSRT
jgi:hypothetical protein